MGTKPRSIASRFWPKVEPTPASDLSPSGYADCWVWRGSTHPTGYGRIKAEAPAIQNRQAHRVAYEMLVGPIPDGHEIHHLCERRNCVNPEHLTPIVRQDHKRLHSAANAGSGSSPVRGVSLTQKGRWKAYCVYRGRQYNFGRFETHAEAVDAVRAGEIALGLDPDRPMGVRSAA